MLQGFRCQHFVPEQFCQLVQAAELRGHLDEHEEVDVKHSARGLRLHRCDHGVAAAGRSAHGRRVAAEGIHAGIRTFGAVRAAWAHAQAVDGRQHHARHDLEGVHAAEWISRGDEPSGIVVR